jgi:hypothetical protein
MTDTEKTTQNNEGKFTQEQLDAKVGERLSRERKSIATKLGIDSYNEENVNKFLDSIKTNNTVRDTFQTENTDLKTKLENEQLTNKMLTADVSPDQIENAKALTNVKLQKDSELTFDTGLAKLMEEMPFLKRGVSQDETQNKTKVGVEIKTTTDTRTEEEKYLEKYKGSRYYNR